MFGPEAFVSLEYETTVSARGIAPANAVVEHLDGSQCRLRTVVLFDPGDTIEFSLRRADGSDAAVRGTVATRIGKGSRFVYFLRLDKMSAKEFVALHDALDEIEEEAPLAGAPSPSDGLTRNCVRVPANFDISYRTPAVDFKPAKAIDISSTGLMMSCRDLLVPGVPVELRFTLPGRRRDRELVAGARVVTRQEPLKGTFFYGLALTCVTDRLRGQLDRFVNATQPLQKRG